MSTSVLRAIPLFSVMEEATLVEISASTSSTSYPKGTLLFSEGDRCRYLWVVLSGTIRVYRSLANGKEYTIDLLGGGEPVALVSFLDGGPYPASAEVLEDAQLLTLGRGAFLKVALREPVILERAIHVMCQRLRNAHQREVELALRTVHERIASVLLHITDTHAAAAPALSHEEVARLVGAARETVTRALHDMARQGAVEIARTGTVVKDPGKLRAWVDS